MWIFSFKTRTWRQLVVHGDATPPQRYSASLLADPVGNCLWLHGGFKARNSMLHHVWRLQLLREGEGQWERLEPPRGAHVYANAGHVGFVHGGALVFAGGLSASAKEGGAVWSFDTSTHGWTRLDAARPAAGCVGAFSTKASRLYVLNAAQKDSPPNAPNPLLSLRVKGGVPELSAPVKGKATRGWWRHQYTCRLTLSLSHSLSHHSCCRACTMHAWGGSGGHLAIPGLQACVV